MRTLPVWDRLVTTIERLSALDKPADVIAESARRAIRPGPVEDQLSGVPLGHPLHPLLVALPIGAWASAGVLDATGQRTAAQRLIGFGLLAALPTAAAGASDWLSTAGAERRVGLVHAVANDLALTAYAVSWLRRRRGRHISGIVWSLVGMSLLSVGGALGGHLSYALGVGVDTTAFQRVPTEWVDAGPADDIPADGRLHAVTVDGVGFAVLRHGDEWSVLADRCTHRGGPLHEGEVADNCVTCPWHGSVFDLADGSVVSGPATRPQPVYEARTRDGRLEIRRDEERTLRVRPV